VERSNIKLEKITHSTSHQIILGW